MAGSQFFEDLLIARAIDILKSSLDQKSEKWCVEFGAGDGIDCSNTYNLIQAGFYSVQIEVNAKEFNLLSKNYFNNEKVALINEAVGFTSDDGLHTLLRRTQCPVQPLLLSIDIDGNDIYAWLALEHYRPNLVLIEFNPSFPNDIDFRQENNPSLFQGSSLLATTNVARDIGYELIGVTPINALFCAQEKFHLFNMRNNNINHLYDNSIYKTSLAQLYDGTLVLLGNDRLMWHRITIDPEDLQVLPKALRSYSASIDVRKVHNHRVATKGDPVVKLENITWLDQNSSD